MTAKTPVYRDRPARVLVVCLIVPILLFWAGADPAAALDVYPCLDWRMVAVGVVFGLVPVLAYWRGYRAAGIVPVGLSLFIAGFWVAKAWGDGGFVSAFGLGLWYGGTIRYFARSKRRTRVHDEPKADSSNWDMLPVIALVAIPFVISASVPFPGGVVPSTLLTVVCWGTLLAFAWLRLFREFFELCLEPIYWLGYRVRSRGPGLNAIPYHGPLLIIANHAAWWDPAFLAKLLHRPITPMMTSLFFDIWFLRPLVKYAFGVIRVADGSYRRDAPEIAEAVRALDAGACVVIFPEGFLRRKEEVPLRRFGRGVWEILRQRPDTPVVACWIEGNWGSWVSYSNGPPMKNKRPDIRRPIDVGFSAPVTLPAETLADHFATRFALMNAVAAARSHLDLPPLPPFARPENDDETKQPAQPGDST